MPDIADYLAISPSSARSQWRSILARSWPEQGKRQVVFTPVETLLCLAASLLVDHRRYGGSTAHRADEPVPRLAQLFKRPNSSVLAKMANLDGSRSNGARHEIEVAARLLSGEENLAAIYRNIMLAARDFDVTHSELPDFLGLEDEAGPLVLLGQDELSPSEIVAAVQEENPSISDPETERLLVGAARIGQHRFAAAVLRNHNHRCVFCGLGLNVDKRPALRMLVASHIKPWRHSQPRERIDFRNGLAACPTHDAAFDTGLLSVDGRLRVIIHPSLHSVIETDPAARAAFGRPPLAEHLLLPDDAVPPQPEYLDWHRTHVYRKDVAPGEDEVGAVKDVLA